MVFTGWHATIHFVAANCVSAMALAQQIHWSDTGASVDIDGVHIYDLHD